MAEEDYRQKFGLRTKVIKLAEIHGQERPPDFVQEFEEIVIETRSMPFEHWRESLRFSYMVMLFHSLKMAYYVLILLLDRYVIRMSEFIDFVANHRFHAEADMIVRELDFYDGVIHRMIQHGDHRGTIMPEYGDLYWDVEEASFLRLTKDADRFYAELTAIVFEFLSVRQIPYEDDVPLITQTLLYQKLRIPQQTPSRATAIDVVFDCNLPEYFEKRFNSDRTPLRPGPTWMRSTPVDWHEDLRHFARESILWGRKSGTMLVAHTYGPALPEHDSVHAH
jgi:hypothetical protein